MHIRSLKIFCDIVSQRSFSRAADRNDISQSAASQVVHQLEQRLGLQLIDRSKRPWVLTSEGEVYARGCRRFVEGYFTLEQKMRSLRDEVEGRVHVAAIYSVGLSDMNEVARDFMDRYPDSQIHVRYQHPDRVHQLVEEDAVDLGLISYPKSSRTIEVLPWRDERMTLVCAAQHELASRGRIGLEALDGRKIVGFDRDLKIRRKIDRYLHDHHVSVDVVVEFDNVETIKRAIEVDTALGILPQPTISHEVAAGRLVEVPIDPDDKGRYWTRPLGIIHRRNRRLSSAAKRFIMELRQSVANTDETSTHQINQEKTTDREQVKL